MSLIRNFFNTLPSLFCFFLFYFFYSSNLYSKCSIGLEIKINNQFNYSNFLQIPSLGSPEKTLPTGEYKVIDIKNSYVKFEGKGSTKVTGWLDEKSTFLDDKYGSYSISEFCEKALVENEIRSTPGKESFDKSKTISFNSNMSESFIDIRENKSDYKGDPNYKYVKDAYVFSISDKYKEYIDFISYGILITSDKSPFDPKDDTAFSGTKSDFNIVAPTRIKKFYDNQIEYKYMKFRSSYSSLNDFFQFPANNNFYRKFNNCFQATISDGSSNKRSITFASNIYTCFDSKFPLTEFNVQKFLKSLYFKGYKNPTDYFDVTDRSKGLNVNNTTVQPLFCLNQKTNKVYESNRSICIGSDTEISNDQYELILATKSKDDTSVEELDDLLSLNNDVNLELELAKKLPEWHFNKNEDYYILGFDNLGNRLVGSAKFIDPYSQKPKSIGEFFKLKKTYEDTMAVPCSFESENLSNYMKNSVLVAKGNFVLDCNGDRKLGRWEQQGSMGSFVTNDKTVYGFFKKSKFDYLGAYLIGDIYDPNLANDIYINVRSSSIENPYSLYSPISSKIENATEKYFYQNSKDTLLASVEQQKYSQYKKFCKSQKTGYVTAYKFDLECNPGWERASLTDYIDYVDKNNYVANENQTQINKDTSKILSQPQPITKSKFGLK